MLWGAVYLGDSLNVKLFGILVAVNMTLSKRGDYVVRSALCLARAFGGGETRKIREVVAEMGVPQTFASQILAELVRAGLASSKSGKDGGYRLSRPPETITLLDVVEAGEGPLRAERCALGDGPCRWQAVCPLHETWQAATGALREILAAATLADVAERDRALELGLLPIPADSHRRHAVEIDIDDSVQVEESLDRLLRGLPRHSRIGQLLQAAYAEVDALRLRLHPDWPNWAVGHLAAALGTRTAAGTDEVDVPLSWEATTVDSLPTHGEAHLQLRTLDRERAELRIHGRLRPPAPPGDQLAARAQLEILTQALVRAFLRLTAKAVEDEMVQAGSARVSTLSH